MRKYKYPLLLILLAIVTHRAWFFDFSILTHGDWGFYLQETQRELLSLPSLWVNSSLGSLNFSISMYPVNLAWGILAHFVNFALSGRLLYLWPSVILATLGSFLLVKKITKSEIGAFIGSLVFTYNTYFLSGRTGHLTVMVAYALAPLVVLAFLKTLEERSIRWVMITGFLAFACSFYEVRAFYIVAWVLFFLVLSHLFFDKTWSKNFLKTLILAGLPMLIVAFLNLYWVLGLIKAGNLTSNEIFGRGLFGDQYLNLPYAITLFHPFWGSPRGVYFQMQPISIYFWLIPIFAFGGLYISRKNKLILFFGLIALLGILLTKQSAAPFTNLYLLLYNHVPGFNAFREASKFYFLVALGYSVLIGSLISQLWILAKKAKFRSYLAMVVTILIGGLFLWNTRNFITGQVGTLFVPRQVPSDYQRLNDFLVEQNEFFRTLWVPTDSRFGIAVTRHPRVSSLIFLTEDWQQKFFDQERLQHNPPSTQERLTAVLQQSFSQNLLNSLSVKYVIIPLQDFANDDDFFVHYGRRRDFINGISNLPYLKKVNIGTQEILVFENLNYRPHVYQTQEKETINRSFSFQKVDFRFEDPTKYAVRIKNLSQPVYLNFSESYHPDWKLRVSEFSRWKVLTQKDYFLPDENHLRTDAGLNSFLIDPEEIKRADPERYAYIENSDGSIDLDLTLYFKPQSYVYAGLIISGITFMVLVSTLAFLIVRNYTWTRKIKLLRSEARLL